MELIYEIGNIKSFKEDGMQFIVYTNVLSNSNIDVIGCYKDHKDIIKRIRRDSGYGKKILELCKEPAVLEISESQKKLTELISSIGKTWEAK